MTTRPAFSQGSDRFIKLSKQNLAINLPSITPREFNKIANFTSESFNSYSKGLSPKTTTANPKHLRAFNSTSEINESMRMQKTFSSTNIRNPNLTINTSTTVKYPDEYVSKRTFTTRAAEVNEFMVQTNQNFFGQKDQVPVSHFIFTKNEKKEDYTREQIKQAYFFPTPSNKLYHGRPTTYGGESNDTTTRASTATVVEPIFKTSLPMKSMKNPREMLKDIKELNPLAHPHLQVPVKLKDSLSSITSIGSRPNFEESHVMRNLKNKKVFRLNKDVASKYKITFHEREKQKKIQAENDVPMYDIIRKNKEKIMVVLDCDDVNPRYCFIDRIKEDKNHPKRKVDVEYNVTVTDVQRKLRVDLSYKYLYYLSSKSVFDLSLIPSSENVLVISNKRILDSCDHVIMHEMVRDFYEYGTNKDISIYSKSHVNSRLMAHLDVQNAMEQKFKNVIAFLESNENQVSSEQMEDLLKLSKKVSKKEFIKRINDLFGLEYNNMETNSLSITAELDKGLEFTDKSVKELEKEKDKSKEKDRTESPGKRSDRPTLTKLLSHEEILSKISLSGHEDGEDESKATEIKDEMIREETESETQKEDDEADDKSERQKYIESAKPLMESKKLKEYKDIMKIYTKEIKDMAFVPAEGEEDDDDDPDIKEEKRKKKMEFISDKIDPLLHKFFYPRKKLDYLDIKEEIKRKEEEMNRTQSNSHKFENLEINELGEGILEGEKKEKKKKVDYIEKNKKALHTKKRDIEILERENTDLFRKNIPRYLKENNLSRNELHQIFIMYKALCQITSQRHKDYNVEDGMDFHSFRNGIYQVFLQSEELQEKIFYTIDENFSGFLNWDEFLSAMVRIRAKTMKDKIDLFIKIADSDGNGMLSKDEIFELAKVCLKKCITAEDGFLDDLCEYFTKLIFESVKYNIDDEIPMQAIKNAIISGNPESDLLAMFCGADI